MLVKAKYFIQFSSAIAKSLERFSLNAATSIVVVWDAVRFHFYDIDLGQLVNGLERELPSDSVLGRFPFELSESAQRSLADTKYRLLSAHFYHYYLSRLPILFRYNRIISRHRKKTLSATETKDVVRLCVKSFSESFSDVDYTLPNDDYFTFIRLKRWFVRPSVRWDAVYSAEWLWDVLRMTYPDILSSDNAGSVTNHVIEASFPMFWNRFSEHYRYSLKCYDCLGWFVGDMDVDELEVALREPEGK